MRRVLILYVETDISQPTWALTENWLLIIALFFSTFFDSFWKSNHYNDICVFRYVQVTGVQWVWLTCGGTIGAYVRIVLGPVLPAVRAMRVARVAPLATVWTGVVIVAREGLNVIRVLFVGHPRPAW